MNKIEGSYIPPERKKPFVAFIENNNTVVFTGLFGAFIGTVDILANKNLSQENSLYVLGFVMFCTVTGVAFEVLEKARKTDRKI